MNREAVILAAGMGTRLKPMTETNHKCLTAVCGVPILVNMLQILEQEKVSRVILVVGYLKDLIKKQIGSFFGKMNIVYVENNKYADTNTSYSLKLGIEQADSADELLVIEGDVFFEKPLMDDIVNTPAENATALEKYYPDLDGTFVELDTDGYVTAWVHKSSRPDAYQLTDKYKTVNIHKFSGRFATQVLEQYLTESIEVFEGGEPIENVMHKIVSGDPKAVRGVVINGRRWVEIDDLHDLDRAENMFREIV